VGLVKLIENESCGISPISGSYCYRDGVEAIHGYCQQASTD
jgi:hypothetical protein